MDAPVNSDFPRPIITELKVALDDLEEKAAKHFVVTLKSDSLCTAKHISITSSGGNNAMVLLVWRREG